MRLKIVASGVCHSDLFFIRGGAGPDCFPAILGHEGAGIVESVGPGVTSVAPGSIIYIIRRQKKIIYQLTKCIISYYR